MTTDDTTPPPAESPHRITTETWSQLVVDLKADVPEKKPRGRVRSKTAATAPSEYSAREGARSAWEIALDTAGRLGMALGDGKFAVLCINDAQHGTPERAVENANGSCVLLPPSQDSIFGLPKCSHGHCKALTLRQWIAAVGVETWEEAVLQARGWRRAREYLLHDTGISGWKRIPFHLRDHQDLADGGPMQVVPNDDDEYAVNFTALIVADVKEHDVTATRRWYEIEANACGIRHRFRVAAQDFNSLSWVANEIGCEAVIMTGRDTVQRLRAGIQFLSSPVPRRDVYAFTGWRQIKGEPVYLHARGGIGAGGAVDGVSVSLAGDVLPRFSLPAVPEGKALRAAVQACMRLFRIGVPEIMVPLFGAVWRAPLGPSPLTVYLSAPPTTGKSLLAALAQQHFGAAMDEGHLPASVKHSTAASVNALRALVGDAVFVLDDFMVSGNTAEDLKLNEKVDSVVRAQYGGTGAQRLSRDGSLATNSAAAPRSTLIITGETLPRNHSLRSRLLVLDMPGPVAQDLDPMKTAAAEGVYASAMAAYVRWLAPRIDKVRGDLRELAGTTAAGLRGAAADTDRDHRLALLLAEVAIGVKYFTEFAVEVGAATLGDREELELLTGETLKVMAAQQLAHRAQQDPVLRFFDLFGAALGAGRCHLTIDDGTAPESASMWGWRVKSSSPTYASENEGSEIPEPFDDHPVPPEAREADASRQKKLSYMGMGDCAGVVHVSEKLVWIKPEIALRIAREMATSVGDPLAITLEDLPRRLFDRGLLAKNDRVRCGVYTTRAPKEAGYKVGYLCLSFKVLGIGEEA